MEIKEKLQEGICTDYLSDLEGGFLRMRLSHKCNCVCEFCYQQHWNDEEQNAEMDPKWIYEYCKPLYSRVKTVFVGGGELTVAKEGYNFCKFLAENYPQTNVLTESNGLLYNEKWQELAVNNLFSAHFSLNAACGETYEEAVWKEGGGKAYQKISTNIKNLTNKYISNGLSAFAPSVSMVVNSKSAKDIYNFIKLALEWRLRGILFYFDHREGSYGGQGFTHPETIEPVLKQLMEIERVLSKKFFIYFRLWLPLNSSQRLQDEVENIPIDVLRKKYEELLFLAKDRDIIKEYEERQKLRRERNKKTYTLDEDIYPTLHKKNIINEKKEKVNVCAIAWHGLDLFATGRLDICAWLNQPLLNIKECIIDEKVDWVKVINNKTCQNLRKNMLQNDFSYCMDCCPLNPKNPHLNDVHKYGLERKTP